MALIAWLVLIPQARSETPDQPLPIERHVWRVFTTANSDLPDNFINALAAGTDGALWVHTNGGLARFHGATLPTGADLRTTGRRGGLEDRGAA